MAKTVKAKEPVVERVEVTGWQSFRDRFLNFHTFHGLYQVPAGLLVMYFAYYYVQYVIAVYLGVRGAQMVYEGVYDFFMNPVAKEASLQIAVQRKLKQRAARLGNK